MLNNSVVPVPPSSFSFSNSLPTFDESLTTLVDIFIINNSGSSSSPWTVEQLARILRSHAGNIDQACDRIININNNNSNSGPSSSAQIQSEEIVWCYDDETEWKRYNAYDAQVLETSYQQLVHQQHSHQQQQGCSLQNGKYRIDFGTSAATTTNHHRNANANANPMKQTNTSTGHQRRIQRLDPGVPSSLGLLSSNHNNNSSKKYLEYAVTASAYSTQQHQHQHQHQSVPQQPPVVIQHQPPAFHTPPPTTPYPQHVSQQHHQHHQPHQVLLAQQQQSQSPRPPPSAPAPQYVPQQHQQQQHHPNPTTLRHHHHHHPQPYPAHYHTKQPQPQPQQDPTTSSEDILKLYNNSSHHNNGTAITNAATTTTTTMNTTTPIVTAHVAPVPQPQQLHLPPQQQQQHPYQEVQPRPQQPNPELNFGGDLAVTDTVSAAAASDVASPASTTMSYSSDSGAADSTAAAPTAESKLRDIETEIIQIQLTKESMKPKVCTELITKICCRLDTIDLTTKTKSQGSQNSNLVELRKKRKELIEMAERIDPSSTSTSTATPAMTSGTADVDNGVMTMNGNSPISALVSQDEGLPPQLGQSLPIQPQQTISQTIPLKEAGGEISTQQKDDELPPKLTQPQEAPPSVVPSSTISASDILQLYSICDDTTPPPVLPTKQEGAVGTTQPVYGRVEVDDLLNYGDSVVNNASNIADEQDPPIQAVASADAFSATDQSPVVKTDVGLLTSSNLVDTPNHHPASHPPVEITSSSSPFDYNSMLQQQQPPPKSSAEIFEAVLPPTETVHQQQNGQARQKPSREYHDSHHNQQYRRIAIARYGFSGDPHQKQISFPEGATLAVYPKDMSEGWVRGQYEGHTGWLPVDYITVLQDTHDIDAQAGHPQIRYQQPQQEQQFEVTTTAVPSTTLLPPTKEEEVSDFETMTVMGGHAENLNTRIALMTDHNSWQVEQDSSMNVKDSGRHDSGDTKLQKSSKQNRKKDKKKGSSKKSTKVAPDTKAKAKTKTKERSSTNTTRPRRVKTNDKKEEK